MTDKTPSSRPDLEFVPLIQDFDRMVYVRDPLGLFPEDKALPVGLFKILLLLDGTRTVEQVRAEVSKHLNGADLPVEAIAKVIADLDESYLLDTPRYQSAKGPVVAAYAAKPVREAALDGLAYPSKPEEAAELIRCILTGREFVRPGEKSEAAGEPGADAAGVAENRARPESGKADAAAQAEQSAHSDKSDQSGQPGQAVQSGQAAQAAQAEPRPAPIALVVPHIDLEAGRAVYAKAYAELRGTSPKTVILLGVGHKLEKGLYSLTAKDFATPLGTVKNDRELSRRLASAAGAAGSETDFAHKLEHSIEFQLLFLQELLPRDSFTIVPILCGSPQLALSGYSRQAFLDAAGPFLAALRAAVADNPDALVVAGVDLCHIGPKFGHMEEAEKMEREALLHDAALLTALTTRDAAAFWRESARVEDRFNVCGFSALATLIEVLPDCRGTVLSHAVSREEGSASAVSFAAAVFR